MHNYIKTYNKKFTKRGPKGAPPQFIYKVSIVVLIDFIAILLTPGIFLTQIINTNNTNIYLINFHSKNIIKMRFPKVEFLKIQTRFKHFIIHLSRWTKFRWHQQRLHNNGTEPDFQKNNLINNN